MLAYTDTSPAPRNVHGPCTSASAPSRTQTGVWPLLRNEQDLAQGSTVRQVRVCLGGLGQGQHLVDDELDLASANQVQDLGHGSLVIIARGHRGQAKTHGGTLFTKARQG